jgi:outer membrane protein
LAALALTTEAIAQGPRARPPLTLGAAVVASPSPYKGVDEQPLTPVPFINVDLDGFYLRGLEAGYRLKDDGPLTVAAVVQPRLQSYSPGDSPALDGMDARRWTTEGGLRTSYRIGRWRAGVAALTDLLDRHGGQEVTGNLGVRLGGPTLFVSPSAGVEWQSAAVVDYYYGVAGDEARAERPAFAGEAAFNPFVAAAARLRLDRRWGLFAYVRHAWLDDAVRDSPIVDRGTVYSGVLAVTAAFGM